MLAIHLNFWSDEGRWVNQTNFITVTPGIDFVLLLKVPIDIFIYKLHIIYIPIFIYFIYILIYFIIQRLSTAKDYPIVNRPRIDV